MPTRTTEDDMVAEPGFVDGRAAVLVGER